MTSHQPADGDGYNSVKKLSLRGWDFSLAQSEGFKKCFFGLHCKIGFNL